MPEPDKPFQPDDDEDVGAMAASAGGRVPKELSGRLAGMPLGRQIFVLAIWPFLQQLLSWLVSTVDTIVAGYQPTEDAANAIAVGGYINWFMGLMVMGIGAGGAALIARAVGGGHKRLAHAGLGQALVMGAVVGVMTGAVIILLADVIGKAAGLEGEALSMASVYLRLVAAFVPVAAVLFVCVHCLTAAGDTRSPFFVMLIMNAINLVATVLLAGIELRINGTLYSVGLGLGVAGIAWGTCIGWTVGALLMIRMVTKRNSSLRLHLHRLRPHLHTMKRIWRVAYPALLDRGGHWAGNWIVVMIVGIIGAASAIGDSVQGAHIIAIRIESISFLPALAFAAAAGTLTGQYLGANDPAMARKAARQCWLIGAGIMAVLGLVFIAIPELLVHLYTDKQVFLDNTPQLVRICGFVQFFFGSALVLQGAMRGAGDTRMPAILSNTLTWFVRLPAAFILGVDEYALFDQVVFQGFGLGLVGIWYALCGELLLRGVVFIIRYLRDGWLKVEV
ncbi:MAG: MATE family efflux transporter [Planctomycetota bacterium]